MNKKKRISHQVVMLPDGEPLPFPQVLCHNEVAAMFLKSNGGCLVCGKELIMLCKVSKVQDGDDRLVVFGLCSEHNFNVGDEPNVPDQAVAKCLPLIVALRIVEKVLPTVTEQTADKPVLMVVDFKKSKPVVFFMA